MRCEGHRQEVLEIDRLSKKAAGGRERELLQGHDEAGACSKKLSMHRSRFEYPRPWERLLRE